MTNKPCSGNLDLIHSYQLPFFLIVSLNSQKMQKKRLVEPRIKNKQDLILTIITIIANISPTECETIRLSNYSRKLIITKETINEPESGENKVIDMHHLIAFTLSS